MFRSGYKDHREATRLYKLAADQGYAHAQYNLGEFYRWGCCGLPKDDREAARLYKLAADQGDGYAKAALESLGPAARRELKKPGRPGN